MIAFCGMPQLLVRKIPETLVKKLKIRAAAHGTSAEEEHRRILREALASSSAPKKKPRTLFDAFRELGEIAPEFEIKPMRKRWKMRPLDL